MVISSLCLTRAMYQLVTETLPPRFVVVSLHLVRILKLWGNVQKYEQNERRARAEGSVDINVHI